MVITGSKMLRIAHYYICELSYDQHFLTHINETNFLSSALEISGMCQTFLSELQVVDHETSVRKTYCASDSTFSI